MQLTLTVKMEAVFASETLVTLSTSAHCKDPRAESTSTVNRCEDLKSVTFPSFATFSHLPLNYTLALLDCQNWMGDKKGCELVFYSVCFFKKQLAGFEKVSLLELSIWKRSDTVEKKFFFLPFFHTILSFNIFFILPFFLYHLFYFFELKKNARFNPLTLHYYSSSRTLGSWVRILLEASMSVCVDS
jgi:hypothetical protein